MDIQFFYEDIQGHVVDENGIELMELAVDEELFAIETISSSIQFLQSKPPERLSKSTMYPPEGRRSDVDAYMELCNKRSYTFYSDDEKTRFFYLFFSKSLSASAAAKQ